jgi:hypothetical protein
MDPLVNPLTRRFFVKWRRPSRTVVNHDLLLRNNVELFYLVSCQYLFFWV